MIFSITYTIFARFLGFSGFIWGVQFTEYSLLWMTLLASAWALKRKKHVSVDLVTGLLSSRAKKYLGLVHGIMGMVVSGIFFWYGAIVTWGQYKRGVVDIQVVDISKYLILMIIPIGFFFLFFQFLRNFVQSLKEIRAGEAPVSSEPESALTHDGGEG